MRKKNSLCALLLCAALTLTAGAHDLFLKFERYFIQPNGQARAQLLSGSFRRSENAVARDRFVDHSLITPSGDRVTTPTGSWRDESNKAVVSLQTGEAGTYLLGVSLKPREITLKGPEFNKYLAHDGLPDTLAARRKNNELNKTARERYSKHVKAIFQVGEARTDNFKTPMSYPVEIVPQQNPYSLKIGDTLEALCLKDGRPIVNQFVMSGRESNERLIPAPNTRTDANGIARIRLAGAGKWYVKFINMTKLDDPNLDYESKWASLTFEIQ